ncbi:MAG TPA: YdeI/OmpD-associated family protein [Allosphingosinicella sp.]
MAVAESVGLAGGVVHELPDDLRDALLAEPAAAAAWRGITPLARNEWICWVQSPKKPETRVKRIAWGIENLRDGKRRPCCWPGCPHRN